jgi:hypothetical protein
MYKYVFILMFIILYTYLKYLHVLTYINTKIHINYLIVIPRKARSSTIKWRVIITDILPNSKMEMCARNQRLVPSRPTLRPPPSPPTTSPLPTPSDWGSLWTSLSFITRFWTHLIEPVTWRNRYVHIYVYIYIYICIIKKPCPSFSPVNLPRISHISPLTLHSYIYRLSMMLLLS